MRHILVVIAFFAVSLGLAGCSSTRYTANFDAAPNGPYTLASGDRLRIIVFGQESLSNSYAVDGSGHISMPLIDTVSAQGLTTTALEHAIEAKLRNGFIREPRVSVEVEAYRPFFVLGEVTTPGQYPYISGMTVQTAVALAGGFTPRAYKDDADLTRMVDGRPLTGRVAITQSVHPGDTIVIRERFFLRGAIVLAASDLAAFDSAAPDLTADLTADLAAHLAPSPVADTNADRKLRILHVLRAPLGGLFRHVLDLTREQIARGHSVGLVTDSLTGGSRADCILAELEPSLALGLLRMPMRRHPHPLDLVNAVRIARHIHALHVDVVHGHGSKGGVYARLPGFAGPLVPSINASIRAYTPHGGSFNFRANAFIETLYMGAERLLAATTDIFLFESGYIAKCCAERVGAVAALTRIVANGIGPSEFVPVEPDADAADLLYVGELRAAKGIDTLIDALALLAQERGKAPRLILVGSGPDQSKLVALADARGVGCAVTFAGALRARDAFRLGRVLVVPSRAESLPYIVLEAAGARVPMIATNVGGIGEIFGPYKDRLICPDDPARLAAALSAIMARGRTDLQVEAEMLADFVATKFKITDMADAVLAGYRDAMARKARPHTVPVGSFNQSG